MNHKQELLWSLWVLSSLSRYLDFQFLQFFFEWVLVKGHGSETVGKKSYE